MFKGYFYLFCAFMTIIFMYLSMSTSLAETNTVSSTVVNNTPPTANAPSIINSNSDICKVGVGASVQNNIVGLASGIVIDDELCQKLKLSRSMYAYGMKVAAVSILCQDSRVWDVELRSHIESDVGHYEGYDISGSFDRDNFTPSSNDLNWGLYRHIIGDNALSGFWGSDGTRTVTVPGTNTITASGKNVDVLIVDSVINTTAINHPEFAVNADGTGGTRVQHFNWFSLTSDLGYGSNGTYDYSDDGINNVITYNNLDEYLLGVHGAVGLASQDLQNQIGNLQALSAQGLGARGSAANIATGGAQQLANLGVLGGTSGLQAATQQGTQLANLAQQLGVSEADLRTGLGAGRSNIALGIGTRAADLAAQTGLNVAGMRTRAGEQLAGQFGTASSQLADLQQAQGAGTASMIGAQTNYMNQLQQSAAAGDAAAQTELAVLQANINQGIGSNLAGVPAAQFIPPPNAAGSILQGAALGYEFGQGLTPSTQSQTTYPVSNMTQMTGTAPAGYQAYNPFGISRIT